MNYIKGFMDFFSDKKLRKIIVAVEACFDLGEDGLHCVGDHVLTEDKPDVRVFVPVLLYRRNAELKDKERVRNIILGNLYGFHYFENNSRYLSMEFDGVMLNSSIPVKRMPATKNSFASQFAKEFVKRYSEPENNSE